MKSLLPLAYLWFFTRYVDEILLARNDLVMIKSDSKVAIIYLLDKGHGWN